MNHKRLKRLNFNQAQWPEIHAELSECDWTDLETAAKTSPTLALSIFMEELITLVERHVPSKQPRKKKNKTSVDRRRKLCWRRLSKVKARIRTASSLHKLTRLLQDKSDLEQQLLEDYTAVNRQEEDKAVFNMKANPKSFFSFSKSRQKTKAKIGPFIDQSTGVPNPDPDFAAAELGRQYSSVFVDPRPEWAVNNVKDFFNMSGSSALLDVEFTEEDIVTACSELKPNSAAGADGVPACLLKTCRKELSHPLFLIWRASLDQGVIPPDLLLVLISPVYKGGSRGSPANYRPVALTSHIVKLFERVLRRKLVAHLEKNGLLPAGQHGFRARRSCLTQLLSYWDKILDQMEEKRC